MRPLNYLLYRTKADNVICYFCMTFLAFVGIAGITITLNSITEEANIRYRCGVYREREDAQRKDEDPEEDMALTARIGVDSFQLAY